jgi:hypothetical protein
MRRIDNGKNGSREGEKMAGDMGVKSRGLWKEFPTCAPASKGDHGSGNSLRASDWHFEEVQERLRSKPKP